MGAVAQGTILSITNKILHELNEASVSTIVNSTTGMAFRVMNNIDNMLQKMYRAFGWAFLEGEDTSIATTAGTRYVAIPASVNEHYMVGVHLLNHATAASADENTPLNPIGYDEWVSWGFELHPDSSIDADKRGTPIYFMVWQRRMYLYPCPDNNPDDAGVGYSIKIHSKTNYAVLSRSVNTTTSQLPLGFEDVLCHGVLALMQLSMNPGLASSYKALYDEGMAELISDYALSNQFQLRL